MTLPILSSRTLVPIYRSIDFVWISNVLNSVVITISVTVHIDLELD